MTDLHLRTTDWSTLGKRSLIFGVFWIPIIAGMAYVAGGMVYGLTRPEHHPGCWRASEEALIDQRLARNVTVGLLQGEPPLVCVQGDTDDGSLRLRWARCYPMVPSCP